TAFVAGVRDWWPGFAPGAEFIVASLDQLRTLVRQAVLTTTDALVQAPPSAKAAMLTELAQYGPSVALDSRADIAASIRQRPISGAVGISITDAVIVGAAYAVLALVVGLVLTASARAREAGHL